jgi:precorrin-3B synthase
MSTTKGFCPSLFEPMPAGDGLLVRIKPRIAGFSSAQLRALADASKAYGSGRIEITNRGNFQIRGLSPATVACFAGAMLDAGLASPDPATERRRNIIFTNFTDPATMFWAAQLESWLDHADLPILPAKFGFAVGQGVVGDITILPCAQQPALVRAAGHATATADPLAAVEALTRAFAKLAKTLSPQPNRMQKLADSLTAPEIFAAAGLSCETFSPSEEPPFPTIGPIGPSAYGIGLAFGVQDHATLHRAADLAENFGNFQLRTSTARSLILLGTAPDPTALIEAAAQHFITNPDDPKLRIFACAGRPSCPSAHIDARAFATIIAPLWTAPGALHVSACAKGCAHPDPAAVTLVAQPGAAANFDLIRNGRTTDTPDQQNLTQTGAIQMLTQNCL